MHAGGRPRYLAVDISAHALQRTREILAAARPEVPVEPVLADYTRELHLPPKPEGSRRLALFLGGAPCNTGGAPAGRVPSPGPAPPGPRGFSPPGADQAPH